MLSSGTQALFADRNGGNMGWQSIDGWQNK